MKFMYSYDIQISGALQGTGGAHEVSLVLDFENFSIFGGLGSESRGSMLFVPNHRSLSKSHLECSDF
ncbi:MAG: hypothetical protein Q8867_06370 [Bacteroidota bacterium]|nr:hypothetical protein [Bacteroidota bacterium]